MSSPTPAQSSGPGRGPGPGTGPGTGPVSLTERRKAETRMEIARAAAGLFVRHGLRGTRAEDIAAAAGVAPRTFYRYFATKEEAVAPLYAAGAERWVESVREAPAELSVREALEYAVRGTLMPGAGAGAGAGTGTGGGAGAGGGVSAASWEWVRALIRLAESSPALRKVWAEVCLGAERTLAGVLGERVALRSALGSSGGEFGEFGEPGAPGFDNVAEVSAEVSAELRFAAAVASAAVRTAVEAWVAGDAPASGEAGPAGLALRNLGAVGGFPWEGGAGVVSA